MTNYTAINTCSCIGENFAITLPLVDGIVRMPLLSRSEVDFHLGGNTDWKQRLAFEWGLLGTIHRRNGDDATAAYCDDRVKRLAAKVAA
jgi:hypothetical protein